MALKKSEPFKGPNIFESPFLHMTEPVLEEYKKYGILPDNMIISKEERDAAPCQFGHGSEEKEQVQLGAI